jgi:heme/copper-type cytochrome/quinol oxidase subunit 3
MSITENDHETADQGGHAGGGHHESPQDRHKKEHIALWMFIGGDAVFFMLEVFVWFYLRSLNTNGMWRGVLCSKANACTDGLGNAITSPIPKAAAFNTVGIFVLLLISAVVIWFTEVQARQGASRKTTTPLAGLAVLVLLGAIVWQIVQFQTLPFTTIDGTYASTFEFYMGSNLAHFLVLFVVAIGLFNRSRLGKYENGHWYQLHLGRLFWGWIAVSATLLGLVAVLFA